MDKPMPDFDGMKSLFRFDDQSDEFAHGFEMGCLWQKLTDGQLDQTDGPYHNTNVETIIRMANHFGVKAKVNAADIDGWIQVEFREVDHG
jgi:hypothetical protein